MAFALEQWHRFCLGFGRLGRPVGRGWCLILKTEDTGTTSLHGLQHHLEIDRTGHAKYCLVPLRTSGETDIRGRNVLQVERKQASREKAVFPPCDRPVVSEARVIDGGVRCRNLNSEVDDV